MDRMVSDEDAVELARSYCSENGLEFVDPIKVERFGKNWRVRTRADARGGHLNIYVDVKSGKVTADRQTMR